jgi:phospholipid transport system substrate-binding protein
MTLRNSIFALSLTFLFALGTTSAHASPDGVGTKTVRQVNTVLAQTLSGKTSSQREETRLLKQARSRLGGFLDIDELGQRALQDHWSKLSETQHKEFLTLLRELIETNYVKGLRTNLKYDVRYLGETKQGEFLLVQTIVQSERKGRPLKIEVDYLLSQSEGKWRTFDIKTDGIGLVENYRAMFNKIIGKSGFDSLLQRMRKKLAALNA